MADRIDRVLGTAAAVIVLAGFWGWRALGTQKGVGPAPVSVPNPNLAQLAPYTSPLSDTLRTFPASTDSITPRRDPLLGQPIPHTAEEKPAGDEQPTRPRNNAEAWRVTTTLMAGSRRAALINDELVYVGDPLPDGSRLTTVERDHVVVTDQKGAAHTVAVAKEGNG